MALKMDEPGQTSTFTAYLEYDATKPEQGYWSKEYETPLQVVVALSFKLGALHGNGVTATVDSIATTGEDGRRWRAFTEQVLHHGNGEIIIHGKRWVAAREITECTKRGPECTGTVGHHESLAGTGKVSPWCEHHWGEICAVHEKNREFESDTPPAWFDPAFAGESWDEPY